MSEIQSIEKQNKPQTMSIQKNSNVGELVANDYRAAAVFHSYGIDFCCRGNRSIEEVCEKNEIQTDALISKLNAALTASNGAGADYTIWPLDALAEHIEKVHHGYVEEKTVILQQYLNKLCKVHGERHPELFKITELFDGCAHAMAAHMKKEELILFPYIKKMVHAERAGEKLDPPHFGTVENPVNMMMEEHDAEGVRFREISALSDNYTPPADACATYKVAFSMLQEFENDLHLHVHLENNILFPKSITLQEKLKK